MMICHAEADVDADFSVGCAPLPLSPSLTPSLSLSSF